MQNENYNRLNHTLVEVIDVVGRRAERSLRICPRSSTNLVFLSSFVSIVLNALLGSFYHDEDNALLLYSILLKENNLCFNPDLC